MNLQKSGKEKAKQNTKNKGADSVEGVSKVKSREENKGSNPNRLVSSKNKQQEPDSKQK